MLQIISWSSPSILPRQLTLRRSTTVATRLWAFKTLMPTNTWSTFTSIITISPPSMGLTRTNHSECSLWMETKSQKSKTFQIYGSRSYLSALTNLLASRASSLCQYSEPWISPRTRLASSKVSKQSKAWSSSIWIWTTSRKLTRWSISRTCLF